LYLAWKIMNAGRPSQGNAAARPMTFLQAAAFQWVNPKAWAMALTAVTVYAPSQTLWTICLVALVFGAINLPAVSSWTMLGQQLRSFLTNDTRLRVFNTTMAVLLVASLYPVLWPA
jgi:threonine/homoserine/homoserine lactone efflux protein